jgi:hypothetical protein
MEVPVRHSYASIDPPKYPMSEDKEAKQMLKGKEPIKQTYSLHQRYQSTIKLKIIETNLVRASYSLVQYRYQQYLLRKSLGPSQF